jgi:hypothetical protein
LTPDVEDGALAAHSVTLGAITESKTYVGGKPTMKQFPQVTRLLAPLTAGLYGVERA